MVHLVLENNTVLEKGPSDGQVDSGAMPFRCRSANQHVPPANERASTSWLSGAVVLTSQLVAVSHM